MSRARKSDWLKTRPPSGERFIEIKRTLREQDLHTVCEEANCPNVGECWSGRDGLGSGEMEAVTDDPRVVSDAEEGLTEAFTTEDRCHQLDLVHVLRTTSYKLCEDGAFSLDERKQIVSEVTNDLFHLKNSVEKPITESHRSVVSMVYTHYN